MSTGSRWVQWGVRPRDGCWPRVYEELAELVSELTTDPSVTNVFFLHKPPGLLVRFETTADRSQWLEDALYRWRALVERMSPGTYEPEEHLFGGPRSMRYAHRLFTVDTRAWLAFHQLDTPAAAWMYSLALLRHVLAGLAIVDWDDLDVWDRIGRQAGRRLPAELVDHSVVAASYAIRALWTDDGRLRGALPAEAATLVDRWGPELRAAGRRWLTGYFAQRGAAIGPREGAAFATIFHWNRGRLPASTQALVTHALAGYRTTSARRFTWSGSTDVASKYSSVQPASSNAPTAARIASGLRSADSAIMSAYGPRKP